MRRTPALILGGGPAGTAAAITLAKRGAGHLLVERTREPVDSLCGGFLSWRTLEQLERLGVDADGLNPARVGRVRVFVAGTHVQARLPRPALAVSRRRLDTVLMDRALAMGAAVERGMAARAVDGATVRFDDGSAWSGEALFLASGKHDVRGAGRPADAAGSDPALGLRLRLPATATLAALVGDAIEIHLFKSGYAGVVLQEDGSANLCMAVRRSRLTQAGSPLKLLALLGRESPALADRLAYAEMDTSRVDAIANVPYGWRARIGRAGLFRVGDQAAVIPSLAGEGMGLALASGISAADAWTAGGAEAAPAWQARFAREVARPMAAAGVLRAGAERPRWSAAMIGLARLAPAVLPLAARLTRLG